MTQHHEDVQLCHQVLGSAMGQILSRHRWLKSKKAMSSHNMHCCDWC